MIPKIIHYCWLSDEPIPYEFEQYIQGWEKKLADYKFIKWDLNRFDLNESVWVKESFESKKYAFACDYIRIYAVYHFGGIYMDMDMEVIRTFNDLLEKDSFFAYEDENKTGIEAGCFGCKKNDRFLAKCLDYYRNRHFIKSSGQYDEIPLPKIMKKILIEEKFELKIFDWDFFTAKSFETGIILVSPNTYTIHHFAGSWKSKEEKKRIYWSQKISAKFGIIGRIMVKSYNFFSNPMKYIKRIL